MVSPIVALIVTVVILVASWLWAGYIDKRILAHDNDPGPTGGVESAAERTS